MKKLFLIFTFTFTLSCYSQHNKKDSIFFIDKSNYLKLKVNYENFHSFIFKNEKFVTSAFGAGIVYEEMNYFAQSKTPPIILKEIKPKNIYDIKEYLNNNREKLIDKKSKKYDSYKLMMYFNTFDVFIKKDDKFIKVKYVTSLAE